MVVSDTAAAAAAAAAPPRRLQFYSLLRHGVVASLDVGAERLGVQCSERVVMVAVAGQLRGYHARTLQHLFTSLAVAPPPLGPSPFALGARWVAFPADQVILQCLLIC